MIRRTKWYGQVTKFVTFSIWTHTNTVMYGLDPHLRFHGSGPVNEASSSHCGGVCLTLMYSTPWRTHYAAWCCSVLIRIIVQTESSRELSPQRATRMCDMACRAIMIIRNNNDIMIIISSSSSSSSSILYNYIYREREIQLYIYIYIHTHIHTYTHINI